MNPNYYGLVEMVFSFGVVLVFAVWQLISLKRDDKKTQRPPDDSKPKKDAD